MAWPSVACEGEAGVALPLIRPPFTAPETHGDTGLGYARLFYQLPGFPCSMFSERFVDPRQHRREVVPLARRERPLAQGHYREAVWT